MSLHDALLAKAFGGGGGSGGVSSWNDLTDKPFGESENAVLLPPTQFVYDGSSFFVTPGYIEFIPGKTYTVNWNGVDYATVCFEGEYEGMLMAGLGNPAAVGGPNNNLPFVIACMQGMIGATPLDGSTAVTVGITGYSVITIDHKYLPVKEPYVYECSNILSFSQNDDRFDLVEPNLPLALLKAVYQRRPIYMKLLGKNDDESYNGFEYYGSASIAGNYQYIQLAMGLVDKTSEIFKIREGTGVVINGKELTTEMMIALMAIRITCRIPYFSNKDCDFMVWFLDSTVLD